VVVVYKAAVDVLRIIGNTFRKKEKLEHHVRKTALVASSPDFLQGKRHVPAHRKENIVFDELDTVKLMEVTDTMTARPEGITAYPDDETVDS